jgi:hypothetical protein
MGSKMSRVTSAGFSLGFSGGGGSPISSFIQKILSQSIMEMSAMNLLVYLLQKLNIVIKLEKIC